MPHFDRMAHDSCLALHLCEDTAASIFADAEDFTEYGDMPTPLIFPIPFTEAMNREFLGIKGDGYRQ